ncbi:hypothetical protein FB45DRAFT_1094209 [Roridomyces roridus]|uniref:F-box domain-containing protein n=1 Tax=Roridomyces roridus TaxID=1738132 RepID=A0AAD7BGL6_9AGAR|nr:hypothetical protein FB45DRAFT_1094209 [Roridomyces roridus]
MSLTKMPPEIFCETLSLLPPKSILKCSTVSRTWHETIVGSPALQYAIRLWKDGLVPGDPVSSSSTDMMRALERRRQAWANPAWTSQTVVKIPPLSTCKAFDISGGVFAMQMRGPDFCTVSLRDLGGADTAESLIQPLGLGIDGGVMQDFTLDPSQDLVALFHQAFPASGTLIFQTLAEYSLRRREVHPLARATISTFLIDRDDTDTGVLLSIQIAGDVVGVAIIEGGCSTLRLWNWREGDWLARLPECDSPYPDFQFLSPRALVQAVPCENGWIEIYMIETGHIRGSSSVVQVATLRLPALDVDSDIDSIGIHAGHTWVHPMPQLPAWFQPTPRYPHSPAHTCRIYLFHLNYETSDELIQTHLFVPHRTLHGYVSRYQQEGLTAPLDIPWEEWGPQNTRMLPGDGYTWTGHVHGERALLPIDDAGKKCMHLLDFSPAIPRDPDIVDSRAPDTRMSFVSAPTTIKEPFENPVTTSLPYRSTMRSMDENFDVLLLDQDHIIGTNSVCVFLFDFSLKC